MTLFSLKQHLLSLNLVKKILDIKSDRMALFVRLFICVWALFPETKDLILILPRLISALDVDLNGRW